MTDRTGIRVTGVDYGGAVAVPRDAADVTRLAPSLGIENSAVEDDGIFIHPSDGGIAMLHVSVVAKEHLSHNLTGWRLQGNFRSAVQCSGLRQQRQPRQATENLTKLCS